MPVTQWDYRDADASKNLLHLGNTEAKKTDIVDTFLDLGRNLLPDNLFQAAFQSVSKFSVFSQHVLIAH